MPDLINCRAIVIAGRDLGESDRLITLYTSAKGKVSAIAKGAKRSRKRFMNALEPFTLLQVSMALPRTSGLIRIDSTVIVESFPSLRETTEKYCMASICTELVNLWTRENDRQDRIYRLFEWYLGALENDKHAKLATLCFKVKLLSFAGYAPDFTRCLKCRKRPHGSVVSFQIHGGGFLCRECKEKRDSRNTISVGTLQSLRYMQQAPLDRLQRLSMGRMSLESAWSIVRNMHCHHLQQVPASYLVLSNMG
ncbi:MAG TPA: DNA repair protein RecO [Thermodesulfobacteriaceae bacterium]|nr:DNA repair protein RecO [Thermodesulfobacteriaceae bacterium]